MYKPSAYFEVILAAIIWGSSGAFVKYLDLPPTTMSFFRLALPTIIVGIFLVWKRTKIFRADNKLMLAASSLNAVRMFFYFLGFTYTSIGNAVIILYTWPIFVSLLSAIFLKEKISKRNQALLATAFIGIIFTYINKELSFASRDFIGMTSMLFSALLYASTVVIFKKKSTSYSRYESIFYQNFIGAIVFLPFIFMNSPLPTIMQTGVASSYGILIGLIGFALFFSALKRIKASTASLLSYIEVVSAIAFGVILFHETLSWNVIIGGVLIISSAILIKR